MDEDGKYHVILPCAHIVGVCVDCDPMFKANKKCMVCMKSITSIQAAYVVE